MCLYECVHKLLWRPEEGINSLGARVTGSCKLPDVGAGNQTQLSPTEPSLQPVATGSEERLRTKAPQD